MTFTVTRLSHSFVRPSEPTPTETLRLSIIDRVPGLRHLVRTLHVFKHGDKAAMVIREALSKALVSYYPLAGRFGLDESGEAVIECTGEGGWFIEATADCSLEDVKYLDHPLMIHESELLPQASPDFDPLNLPFMMQITEFTCGGFIVGLITVHAIGDGIGIAPFINAIGELARGGSRPSIEAGWARDIIPNPTYPASGPPVFPTFKLQPTVFDIPTNTINQIKAAYFEATGQRCSAFDVSTAISWQARTRALKFAADTPIKVCFFANIRHLLPLDGTGFFGNGIYPVVVKAKSEEVADGKVTDVVRIVRDAKAELPAEFAKWARGGFEQDPYELTFDYQTLFVSDWNRLGFHDVDYGWGKPVHMVPFPLVDIMALAIFAAPPAPAKGVRSVTKCVEKEHLVDFQDEMSKFTGNY